MTFSKNVSVLLAGIFGTGTTVKSRHSTTPYFQYENRDDSRRLAYMSEPNPSVDTRSCHTLQAFKHVLHTLNIATRNSVFDCTLGNLLIKILGALLGDDGGIKLEREMVRTAQICRDGLLQYSVVAHARGHLRHKPSQPWRFRNTPEMK